jgi:hypothetical protein
VFSIEKDPSISKMVSGGTSFYANPDEEVVRECIKVHNDSHDEKMVFTNQSVVSFGTGVFKELYPLHKKSRLNAFVFENFKATGGLIQNFMRNDEEGKITDTFSVDINKCRTSIMGRNVLGPYKRFGIMDEVHEFDGKGFDRPGFYYALSDDFNPPMRGNGWYSDGFLKYI